MFENQEPFIYGSKLFDPMEYKEWIIQIKNKSTGGKRYEQLEAPATTFFAVRKHDANIVGMIVVRHHLKSKFLQKYGGHVGFAVRPSKKRQGTEIVKMAIAHAKSPSIKKLMLGCFLNNFASHKQ